MFCSGCGQELIGEVNFCHKWGKPQNSPPATVLHGPQRRRHRRRGLWNLHTLQWWGECPTCRHLHDSNSSRCPNDDSPLVVAFNASRWNPLIFLELPMRSAHLMCSSACGFTTKATTCTQCGSLITGRNVHFKIPWLGNFMYQLFWSSWVSLSFLVIGATIWLLYSGWKPSVAQLETLLGTVLAPDMMPDKASLASFDLRPGACIISLICAYFLIVPMAGWRWKFRTRLDFERCMRR